MKSSAQAAATATPLAAQHREALPATPEALLDAVLAANRGTTNPRLKQILDALLRHLHAFAVEVDLSYQELEVGLDFLVRIGKATGPEKHEGILLADILGLATLVGLIDAKRSLAAGGTEPALIGPFWRAAQPLRENGAPIAAEGTPGERLFVSGRILSLDGEPIANARVETWQASPGGLYENQDPHQEEMNLRGRFQTDADGRFSFHSVRPSGYAVPVDGPCGELLDAQQRAIMRPAHLHFIVMAEGYKTLATQIFDADDPNAYRDVVFGAVGSLLHRFERQSDGSFRLDLDLKLEAGTMRVPMCPLP
ncbi:dioxygenase [Paraburkholderia sp. DHOC27]|uniref:dioxygenase family protein n=1 Tax=Paraburkholderia sp. DHOC27 TaxID=2303330 RepID=UPI000E3CBFAA|nr:dioxygenase [Paraburkholderia sp. DHOC27]RFU44756.1 protocatechuate 3,4-dioxygenase [Paraburkholderia sp. DHOC27]